ncbi:UNVERIFIED_ORG: hypothetical protein ABIB13_002215 [Arthrobacter sp. UYEF2]
MDEFILILWARLVGGFAQAPPLQPSPLELGLALVAAALLVVPNVIWQTTGVFVTVVHELGHAAAATLTGRFVTGIKIRLNQSGETLSYGRTEGPGVAWAIFWGYPVPALVGSGLLWAALAGWAPFTLSLGTLILIGSIAAIRNWAGLVITLGSAGVAGLLLWLGTADALGHFTLALGLALLAGAARAWLNLVQIHSSRPDELETSDANILGRSTGTPDGLWLGLFAVVIAGAWLFGGLTLAASILPHR